MNDEEASEMREVWDDLEATDDPDAREFLLEQLASIALELHDFTACDVTDATHEPFEALRRARETYHLAAVRLGRLVARMMESNEVLERLQVHADDPSAN